MNEHGCPGIKVAPHREAGIYLAAIKVLQMLLQHTAPSSHHLPKPNDEQSYLSSQFIPLDKAVLLPQLQMPCMWDGLLLLPRGTPSTLCTQGSLPHTCVT